MVDLRDADKIAPYNPLRRVPTLVLDDGEVLIESTAILDHLDETVGPSRAMIAENGPRRRKTLKVCALASGLGDKAVSLGYERLLHREKSDVWMKRCETQIAGVLDALEADRAVRKSAFWFGDKIGHADIAVACVIRFTREAHPGVVRRETLASTGDACGALRGATAVPGDRAAVLRAGDLRSVLYFALTGSCSWGRAATASPLPKIVESLRVRPVSMLT